MRNGSAVINDTGHNICRIPRHFQQYFFPVTGIFYGITDIIFKDLNNSLSKEDVESEIELITAYIDTYFSEQKTNWNNLMDKLTEISNITGGILVNYQENLEVINDPNFKNDALDNADSSLKKASEINIEIENLTFQIREEIIEKINKSKKTLKNSFDFNL